MSKLLWSPSEEIISNSRLTAFRETVEKKYPGISLDSYQDLHRWSITNSEQFWDQVWVFFNLIGTKNSPVVNHIDAIEKAEWFPQSSISFAQNLLTKTESSRNIALTEINSNGSKTAISYKELERQVNNTAHYLTSIGVVSGDVVSGILENGIETVIAFLATVKIGAIWTVCGADFGIDAITERLIQTQPKVLFTLGDCNNSKKNQRHLDKVKASLLALPSVKHLIICKGLEIKDLPTQLDSAILLSNIEKISTEITYQEFPFNHPLCIVYSSGTTGKPKCIVHGAGGTLIQHTKELGLHTELTEKDTLFFYTSCSWMMWNWMISGLSFGAKIVLFDGSPISPTPSKLFDICRDEKVTILGLNPRYLQACFKTGVSCIKEKKLPFLHTILSTGSVLPAYLYDYIYKNIKNDVIVSSIAGGTDIIGCFCLGSSLSPVYAGEAQVKGLGFDIQVFDDNGISKPSGVGELVCCNAFPSRPIGLWNDKTGEKFHQTYFSQNPGVWTHGDFIEISEHNGIIFHGRSDATLNPGGIRIGSAEIYQQLVNFCEIEDAIATELRSKDESILMLFIKLSDGHLLSKELTRNIMRAIGDNTTENHVPNRIISAPDLPRTYSGKTIELVVKNIINHQEIKNAAAISNPDSLTFFYEFARNLRA